MKILCCAYDRPGHIATGPNAWLQRLVPDLLETDGLQVERLFVRNVEPKGARVFFLFKMPELTFININL